MKTFAQNKRFLALGLWACGFSGVLSESACNRQKPKVVDAGEQCQEVEHNDFLSASLKKLAPGCSSNAKTSIYAHYIQQTMNDTVCFEDVISNQAGKVSCSPGPYLTEGQALDQKNGKWTFKSTPDYFTWHLGRDFADQNIYITNQNGFPIKSQVIRLQNKDEATLVLLPKAVLDEGSSYYIYLTFNQNNSRQTWIQPIAIGPVAAKE